MTMIKGIPIILYNEKQIGLDPFKEPIIEEVPITVENVLVSPTLSDEVINTLNLTGKKAEYTLAIPKGDTHEWENKKVRFFGKNWRVFGMPIQGIEDLIPLDWNKKVMVERYE